jgi:hypothetical protein
MNTKKLENSFKEIEDLRKRLGLPAMAGQPDSRQGLVSSVELAQIVENLDVTSRQEYFSHRKILGPIIVFAKKVIVNDILGRLFRLGLARQWALNHYIYITAAAVAEMDERLADIENRLVKLESKG